VPAGVLQKDVEYYSGLLSGQGGRVIKEAFISGTEPNRQVNPQWNTINSLPWYQQKAFYIPKEGENVQSKDAAATPGAAPAPQDAPPPTPGPQDAPAEEPPPPPATPPPA
jgi:hypothetical protein